MTTTAADLHRSRLHPYWHQTPLCEACDDRCETHTLNHCDERSHYAPGYRDCEECPKCVHCGDRFVEVGEVYWLFYLPELDHEAHVGWCSGRCLSADCDEQPESVQYAQDLLAEWNSCHWGDHGLELSFLTWIGVRTDRELRTFVALRAEIERQQHTACATQAEIERQPHTDHDRRAALNRGFGALGAVVEALLQCDLPAERRDYAQKALARIRKEVEA